MSTTTKHCSICGQSAKYVVVDTETGKAIGRFCNRQCGADFMYLTRQLGTRRLVSVLAQVPGEVGA